MLSWPHRTSANIISICFWLLETWTKCSYFIEENIRPGSQRLAFEVKYEYFVRRPRIYRGPAFCAWVSFQTTGVRCVNLIYSKRSNPNCNGDRRDKMVLRTTCIKNVNFKIIKTRSGCQYVWYFHCSLQLKPKLGRTKASTEPWVGHSWLRAMASCSAPVCWLSHMKQLTIVHLYRWLKLNRSPQWLRSGWTQTDYMLLCNLRCNYCLEFLANYNCTSPKSLKYSCNYFTKLGNYTYIQLTHKTYIR